MAAWTKSAVSLGIGVSLGIVLRVILPSDRGLTFLQGGVFHVVPFNRLAFWLCLATAAVTASLFAARGGMAR